MREGVMLDRVLGYVAARTEGFAVRSNALLLPLRFLFRTRGQSTSVCGRLM